MGEIVACPWRPSSRVERIALVVRFEDERYGRGAVIAPRAHLETLTMTRSGNSDRPPRDSFGPDSLFGRGASSRRPGARRVAGGRLGALLGRRGESDLPTATRARFEAMGLPNEAVARSLREIQDLEDWPEAWTRTAQRFLGEARRADHAGHRREAAVARRHAALCYHTALLAGVADPRTARALRASASGLFAQAVPTLMPSARRVEIAWRTTPLPGYLLSPDPTNGPFPLAVFLNGATTAKEETLRWATPFAQHGLAVLALDWPGTGEAYSGRLTADVDDITDGLTALAADEPALDEARIALVGFGLGGAVAIRAAAYDRRIAASVAVTPPFDASRWLAHANPVILDQLAYLLGDTLDLHDLAAEFALPELMRRLRCPLLVFGAGRDVVVPPGEAKHLAAAAGPLGTLIWYPEAGHGLYEVVDDWTDDAARWLSVILGDAAPDSAAEASTQVDGAGDAIPSGAESSGTSPIKDG